MLFDNLVNLNIYLFFKSIQCYFLNQTTMNYLLVFVLLISSPFATLSQHKELSPGDYQSIMGVIKMQEEAWNRGDIEKFMTGYWNSPQTVFAGASGPVYGWDKVMNRYLKTYPNQEAMGTLQFEVIDVYQFGKNVALMNGKFELTRQSGDLGGYFTLVWKKIKKEWLIISDHTSVSNP
jgi:hypothetical protein